MLGECHGHIILDGTDFKKAIAAHREEPNETIIRNRFQRYKDNGIFFFRDGGDNLGVSERAARIAPEYGIDYRTPVFATHRKGCYGSIVGRSFETISDFALLVEELKKKKADFVKIMVSGIMDFSRFGTITEGALTLAQISEIVHISHSEGFSVMAHVNGAVNIRNALAAGVDSIEHGCYMDDIAIDMLVHSETVWVPTAAAICNVANDPKQRFDQENAAKIAETHFVNIGKAISRGAKMAAGSDAGAYLVPHCDGLRDEIVYFKEIINDDLFCLQLLEKGETIIKEKFRRYHG